MSKKRTLTRKRPNSNTKNPPSKKSTQASVRKSSHPKAQAPKSSTNRALRLLMVWGVMLFGAVGLAINLYRLQILESTKLREEAQEQHMVNLRPYIPRRPIVDRKGNVVATDRLVYNLYAHPKLFKVSPDEIATKLAGVLTNKTREELLEKFQQKETGIRIDYRLMEEKADKITDLSLDGIELVRQYSRLYPHQEMVAEVVGYASLEHKGKSGVEYTQEELLERTMRSVRLKKAGNGAIMPFNVADGFLNFDKLQLQLTIDLRLQRAARSYLTQQMEKYDADRGAVIVMDVEDGSIMAMVNEPTYNPNNYFDYPVKLFNNWAITDLYEPGSTFKPINIAIALDAGTIKPDTTVYDSGTIKIETWDISNYDYEKKGARGKQTVAEILQHSSNVGMIKLMETMPSPAYYDALKNLTLQEKVGIELLGEARGQLKSQKQFTATPVEPATASFGQGFSLTPMKLVQLHAAIANGGKLVTPHVVKSLQDSDGNIHWQPELESSQLFSPATSQTVLSMMESVVTKGGVRKHAYINRHRVAGKTGTAQKASPNGGYFKDAKITSFVGILPVSSPRYVVLAVVDEPKGKSVFGSTVAAPIVKSVMEALIAIEAIPPEG